MLKLLANLQLDHLSPLKILHWVAFQLAIPLIVILQDSQFEINLHLHNGQLLSQEAM